MFATKPDESKLRHTPSQIPEEPKPTLTKRLLSFTPHENIYTVPNILTLSRLLAAPLVGYLVIHDRHAWALGLFAYAGITDLADGWIARRWKQQTVVGTVIDPMADKMLMTILTGVLAWKGAMPSKPLPPIHRTAASIAGHCRPMLTLPVSQVWCAGIILSRDILLAITAIYYRWISLPPPKTFSRYWDFSLPSAEVHPTGISKINTALQLGLIGWTVSMPVLQGTAWGPGLETALVGMQYLVATTTIWSGASYIYTKDAVKILSHEEREQKLNEKAVKDKDAPR
ncbi:hypothetical protein MMC25_007488 [Agyrium rufum]|nr:hypothetical protein [Agyrium rufum]